MASSLPILRIEASHGIEPGQQVQRNVGFFGGERSPQASRVESRGSDAPPFVGLMGSLHDESLDISSCASRIRI